MKTILAENRFILTKTLFYEGMRRVSAASYGKTVKKLLIGVALLWLALSVWTVRRSGSVSYALMELAVLAAVSLWLAVLLPRGRARRAWKRPQRDWPARRRDWRQSEGCPAPSGPIGSDRSGFRRWR